VATFCDFFNACSLSWPTSTFHENTVLGWRVALRRDRGPDEAGPSSIFIRGRELEKIMGHFHEAQQSGMNQLVAHKSNCATVGRPRGYVNRALAAEELG